MLWLIGILAFFGVGNALYEQDNTQDIYNYTSEFSNKLNISFEYEPVHTPGEDPPFSIMVDRILVITFGYVDFLFLVLIQVMKTGIEFGFSYPNFNMVTIMHFLPTFAYIILVAVVLYILIQGLPIVVATVYLLWAAARNLLSKLKKKDKEEKKG